MKRIKQQQKARPRNVTFIDGIKNFDIIKPIFKPILTAE